MITCLIALVFNNGITMKENVNGKIISEGHLFYEVDFSGVLKNNGYNSYKEYRNVLVEKNKCIK